MANVPNPFLAGALDFGVWPSSPRQPATSSSVPASPHALRQSLPSQSPKVSLRSPPTPGDPFALDPYWRAQSPVYTPREISSRHTLPSSPAASTIPPMPSMPSMPLSTGRMTPAYPQAAQVNLFPQGPLGTTYSQPGQALPQVPPSPARSHVRAVSVAGPALLAPPVPQAPCLHPGLEMHLATPRPVQVWVETMEGRSAPEGPEIGRPADRGGESQGSPLPGPRLAQPAATDEVAASVAAAIVAGVSASVSSEGSPMKELRRGRSPSPERPRAETASLSRARESSPVRCELRDLARGFECFKRELVELKGLQSKQQTELQALQRKLTLQSRKRPESETKVEVRQDEFGDLVRELEKQRGEVEALRAVHTQEIGRFVLELGELRSLQATAAQESKRHEDVLEQHGGALELCRESAERHEATLERYSGALEKHSSTLQLHALKFESHEEINGETGENQEDADRWSNLAESLRPHSVRQLDAIRRDTGKCLAEVAELRDTQTREVRGLKQQQNLLLDRVLRGVDADMRKLRQDLLRDLRPLAAQLSEETAEPCLTPTPKSAGSPRQERQVSRLGMRL